MGIILCTLIYGYQGYGVYWVSSCDRIYLILFVGWVCLWAWYIFSLRIGLEWFLRIGLFGLCDRGCSW